MSKQLPVQILGMCGVSTSRLSGCGFRSSMSMKRSKQTVCRHSSRQSLQSMQSLQSLRSRRRSTGSRQRWLQYGCGMDL